MASGVRSASEMTELAPPLHGSCLLNDPDSLLPVVGAGQQSLDCGDLEDPLDDGGCAHLEDDRVLSAIGRP